MSSTNGINGINTSSMMAMGMMRPMKRPDPGEMAQNLFSKLDTQNQGYIEKSDLQSALTQPSDSSASSNVDELFSQLDGDGDGKVTQQEFSDSLKQLMDQLDSQMQAMRMRDGMQAGGMPPPPPPSDGSGDTGFTKEELTSQLTEIGTSDSKRASLISNILENFSDADTDGNGRVDFKEAMALDSASSANADTQGTASGTDTGNEAQNARVMAQILRLVKAYGLDSAGSQTSTGLSVTA